MITIEDVLERFDYDSERGALLSKRARKGVPSGSVIGYKNEKGYLRCRVNGKTLKVHRVIWLLENGKFPEDELDHINGNKEDNRISNLREVTSQENQQNRKNVKGYYKTANGRYRVDLYFNHVKKTIGTFDTAEEASSAYWDAKKKHYSGYVETTKEEIWEI